MSYVAVNPVQQFYDINGKPLENGRIYFGVAGQDATLSPTTVYWDSAVTQVATQPIQVIGGFPVNNGVRANVYVNNDYSILVQNRNGQMVFSALSAPLFGQGGGGGGASNEGNEQQMLASNGLVGSTFRRTDLSPNKIYQCFALPSNSASNWGEIQPSLFGEVWLEAGTWNSRPTDPDQFDPNTTYWRRMTNVGITSNGSIWVWDHTAEKWTTDGRWVDFYILGAPIEIVSTTAPGSGVAPDVAIPMPAGLWAEGARVRVQGSIMTGTLSTPADDLDQNATTRFTLDESPANTDQTISEVGRPNTSAGMYTFVRWFRRIGDFIYECSGGNAATSEWGGIQSGLQPSGIAIGGTGYDVNTKTTYLGIRSNLNAADAGSKLTLLELNAQILV